MEWLILGTFSASLLICISLDLSILYALGLGLFLFLMYGRKRGFSWHELIGMTFDGIKTVRNILITLFLIGVMTAFWKASGTIAVIVCYASRLIRPSVFLLMTFLLNSGVSVLTGTSFGTAATMGVICASIGNSVGISPMLTGGAVLSGVFFGDRCSPVSTSALLIADVTETDIYHNIRLMLHTALIPFLLTCAAYLVLGLRLPGAGGAVNLEQLFSTEYTLHWLCLLPAVVILVFAVCRVNVRLAMTTSILSAVPLCMFLQHMPLIGLLNTAVSGYAPQNAAVAALISGGGVVSMLRVTGIVCLSCSYSDLFRKTGLLTGAKRIIAALERKTTPFTATLVTATVTGLIVCNQTLTILLTNQLCMERNPERQGFAVDLEDTAAVIPPLIPWSIAGAVPLSSVGAPATAILVSFYLYLLPLWRELLSWIQSKQTKPSGKAEHT